MASLTGKRWPLVGKKLSDEFPYIEAEVKYSMKEYACTLVDVLARRTRLAFLSVHVAQEVVSKISDIMAKELGWDKARKRVSVCVCVWCGLVRVGVASQESAA
jgi:glycerol-3-phosphate dehydrogenase